MASVNYPGPRCWRDTASASCHSHSLPHERAHVDFSLSLSLANSASCVLARECSSAKTSGRRYVYEGALAAFCSNEIRMKRDKTERAGAGKGQLEKDKPTNKKKQKTRKKKCSKGVHHSRSNTKEM